MSNDFVNKLNTVIGGSIKTVEFAEIIQKEIKKAHCENEVDRESCLVLLTGFKSLPTDGRLEIDNNKAERTIKPFVIGRKNWLFHGNDIGAQAGSILFSLIETCKQNKVDVFSWLKYVLTNIHQAQINSRSATIPARHSLPN